MTYASAFERRDLINGLRALAEFLESNPDVPAPPDTVLFVFPPSLDRDDQERRAEIDIIASRLYTQAYELIRGHYTVSRHFGPVEYRAIAIKRQNPANSGGA
jgi:hypothetical protein